MQARAGPRPLEGPLPLSGLLASCAVRARVRRNMVVRVLKDQSGSAFVART